MKEIIITIDKDGETKIEAVGYRGKSCEAATKPLEAALGVVAGRERKPEFHALELPEAAKVGQR